MNNQDQTGSQTTPEQANSLIEQRLQELRAFALGSPSGDDGHISPPSGRINLNASDVSSAIGSASSPGAAPTAAPSSVRQLVNDLKQAATPSPERRLSAVPSPPVAVAENIATAPEADAEPEIAEIAEIDHETEPVLEVQSDGVPEPAGSSIAAFSAAARGRRGADRTGGSPDSADRIAQRIDASLGKIGHLVGEDISRLEQTLASWGSPSAAATQLHEQLTATLQRIEHGIRRDLTEVAAQVAETSEIIPSQESLLEALAAWSVTFERRVDMRISESKGALINIADQIEATNTSLNSELTQVGLSMADNTESAMRSIIEETGKASKAEREHLQEIADTLSAARDGAEGAVNRMVDASHDLRAGLAETLGEGHAELRKLLGGHINEANEQVLDAVASSASELSETLHVHIGTESEETQRTVRQTGRQLVDNVDGLRTRLDEQITRIDELINDRVTSLGTKIDDRAVEVVDQVHTRSDRTNAKLDEGIASLTQSIDGATNLLSQNLTTQQDFIATEIGATRSALTSEINYLQKHLPIGIADSVGERISSIDNQIAERLDLAIQRVIGEIDYNRLHAVRDLEMMVDTMTSGWAAVIHQMQTTESRLTRLEMTVEQWFGALADESSDA